MQIVKTIADVTRQSQVRPDNFQVIATQRLPGYRQTIADWPFADAVDPIQMVRKAVESGHMIMA